MAKILLITIYDCLYTGNAYCFIPSENSLRELDVTTEDLEPFAYGEDNVYKLRMSARALVDKLNLAAVDGLMIVEDGGVNYYGRL